MRPAYKFCLPLCNVITFTDVHCSRWAQRASKTFMGGGACPLQDSQPKKQGREGGNGAPPPGHKRLEHSRRTETNGKGFGRLLSYIFPTGHVLEACRATCFKVSVPIKCPITRYTKQWPHVCSDTIGLFCCAIKHPRSSDTKTGV